MPTGISGPKDFEVKESRLAEIGAGEMLTESHYAGVDAALRLIVMDSGEFLLRVKPDDIVYGSIAGNIMESNSSEFEVGEYVLVSGGLQNYAISNRVGLERCDVSQKPREAGSAVVVCWT
ncbi:MAG: NADPH-dependent curcumin reductase CurA [Candidatus Azotimanducaceae bacterium]